MPLFKNPFKNLSKSSVVEASDDISQVENNKPPSCDGKDQICIVGNVKLLDLPSELIVHIGQFMDVRLLNSLALCNSRMLLLFFNVEKNVIEKDYETVDESFERVQQLIWKPLVFSYYPRFEKSLNVKNWQHLLRRRMQHVKLHGSQFKLDIPTFVQSKHDEMIENCEWIFKCPLKFDDLQSHPSELGVKFCTR
ncbi:predicted protein [Naegleria gruberi]|uniref:Predicted protein n=1 Tax=Naegleria gruberi TaxID=5762 RepID=D2V0I8_NAEGR|nr:uncharacterized protein NAEGRDRAFT_62310 [Naegleria gruberi]EFC49728.1 predicted protein [Naegleria gruberi]|eukprot:XP_002682472.1 predicted protein [Naegleria gruberi strain NEG-M]